MKIRMRASVRKGPLYRATVRQSENGDRTGHSARPSRSRGRSAADRSGATWPPARARRAVRGSAGGEMEVGSSPPRRQREGRVDARSDQRVPGDDRCPLDRLRVREKLAAAPSQDTSTAAFKRAARHAAGGRIPPRDCSTSTRPVWRQARWPGGSCQPITERAAESDDDAHRVTEPAWGAPDRLTRREPSLWSSSHRSRASPSLTMRVDQAEPSARAELPPKEPCLGRSSAGRFTRSWPREGCWKCARNRHGCVSFRRNSRGAAGTSAHRRFRLLVRAA
jgi:hypothetical protein